MLTFGYSVEFISGTINVYDTWPRTKKNIGHCYTVWKKDGRVHRNNEPAITCTMGDLYDCGAGHVARYSWRYHDQSHRIDGPSDESLDLWQVWYLHGVSYRYNGPTFMNGRGTVSWYQEGSVSGRIDGPSDIDANGDIGWFVDDTLHRTDGPAIMYADGSYVFYHHGEEVL